MSKSTLIKCALGVGTASALALSAATPVRAAPVLSNTAAVNAAAHAAVTDVRYYYRYPSYGYGYSPYHNDGHAPYYSYGYRYSPYYSYGYSPYSSYGSYGYVPY